MITADRLHQAWRSLPFGSLDDIIGVGPCLVLAPHPDDESLGCGGLIAACCAEARPPVIAILTDGSGSHPGSRLFPPPKLAERRETEASRAVELLGVPPDRLFFLRERDGQAPRQGPRFEAAVRRAADLIQGFGCSTILSTWRFDPHCDHAAAGAIAAAVARLTGVRLLAFPVWGWTVPDRTILEEDAVRGWRFAVAPYEERKRQAIAAHASQHGTLITDVPDAFRLPDKLLLSLTGPFETYLLP